MMSSGLKHELRHLFNFFKIKLSPKINTKAAALQNALGIIIKFNIMRSK